MSSKKQLEDLLKETSTDGRQLRTERGPYSPRKDSSSSLFSMDPEELSKPGGALVAMLIKKSQENGHKMSEMAAHLGVTYPYINQLRTGERKIENISLEFTKSCAAYLGVQNIVIYMLAGKLALSDFHVQDDNLTGEIERAFEYVKTEPTIGAFMPGELHPISLQSKLFIIKLFEKATGQNLLSNRIEIEQAALIAQTVEEARKKLLENGIQHSKIHSVK